MADNEIMTRIMDTMKKRGIRQKELMQSIGIASTNFSKWKYDNAKSYLNYIDNIAKCLQVTPEYLLNGTIDESEKINYSVEDIEFLNDICKLSARHKTMIRSLVKELLLLYEPN